MRCCPQCTHHWPAVKGGDPRCQACGYEKSIRFGSTREMKRYIELRMELQLGRIHSLVLQPRFPFPPGFTYVADFTYVDATGSQVVEDTKGAITEAFGLKRKCFKYFYPTLDLRVLK